jgi:hypothetical protein
MYWLGFIDDDAKSGYQFLGGCFVPADDYESARAWATVNQLDPGGRCVSRAVAPDRPVPPEWIGVLLRTPDLKVSWKWVRVLFSKEEIAEAVAKAAPWLADLGDETFN